MVMFLAVVPREAVSLAWTILTGRGCNIAWSKILLLIRCQLASRPKVKLTHAVVSGVVGPHGCKYLTNQVEVLLDQSLLDRFTLCGQKASKDMLGETFEEGNGVLNGLEVGVDLQPAAEAPPLVPGGDVFTKDGGR